MSRLSGFVGRARGTGRPTKKDRRSLEEFTTPEYLDDLLFDFDVETKKAGKTIKVYPQKAVTGLLSPLLAK